MLTRFPHNALFLLALLSYQESSACTFSPESLILDDPIGALEWADAVFSATVVSQVAIERKATSRASIEVHEVWKGDVSSLLSLDNHLGSTCSKALFENGRYVFFASRRGKRLHVTGTFVPASWARGVVEALRGS
jgi:hypothetical protein